jgi:tetratricopeptide (TPR) repeat protein
MSTSGIHRIAALLLVFLLSFPVDACIWTKGTTKEGAEVRMSLGPASILRSQLRHSIETDLRAEGESMERALRGSPAFANRNDYAVALMYLGRAAEAVELLQKLEAEKPGDYGVAANLGTAYELSGRNQDAKKWIEEAVRRNPDSHYGTEWLHVKILEAKIQQDKDPAYFDRHSVLNLDYRSLTTGAQSIPVGGEQMEVKKVHEALQYQLSERLKFIKKSDPVVASLLFDYAAIEAGTGTLEGASGLLKMAAEYGYPAGRINPLLEKYAATIRFARLKKNFYIGAACFAVVGLIAYGIKRRWFTYRRPPVRSAVPT